MHTDYPVYAFYTQDKVVSVFWSFYANPGNKPGWYCKVSESNTPGSKAITDNLESDFPLNLADESLTVEEAEQESAQ